MAQVSDKVTMLPNATYSPYNNLKSENLKASVAPNVNTMTVKSRIERTISGRIVYKPILPR